jgi:predicted permease
MAADGADRDPWRERWRRLAGREPADEVDDELAFHLEMRAREGEVLGLPPHTARERAERRFGDLEAVRRECKRMVTRRERRMARSEALEQLMQDVRFALRGLRRQPGFTAVAVLTLALGIGANSAIFAVVDAVLLRPLPYPDPERLVRVYHANPRDGVWDGRFSPPDFEDAVAGARRFASISTFLFEPDQSGVNLRGDNGPVRLPSAHVDAAFFPTLGTAPALGRTFQPADLVEGRDRVLVISQRLWRTRFAGRRDLIGRPLSLDGEPFTVLGVMPESFAYPTPEVDVWLPISLIGEDDIPTFRGLRWLDVVARLAPGATAAEGAGELSRTLARLAAEHADSNEGWDRAIVQSLHGDLVGEVEPVLKVLFAAVCLVLLIACANLVNLLLARGTARAGELAVRSALGAERWRLVRQLLTEGLVLALAGGALALALAHWGVRLLVTIAGEHLPRALEIRADGRWIAFTLLVSVAAALLFGLLPALRWSAPTRARAALRGEARTTAGGGEREALRGALVVAQTSLAALLLVGAGLLVHSLWRLTSEDPGFRAEGVLAASVTFPSDLPEGELPRRRDALLARIRAVPGAVAVGGSKTLPLSGQSEPYGFALPERPEEHLVPTGGATIVTPGYFAALGIPLLRGREFRSDETRETPLSIIVNAALARQHWGTVDAVGKTVLIFQTPATVVGVVGDVRAQGLGQPAPAALYVGSHRAPRSSLKVFVRTTGEPAAVAGAVRRAIAEVEPDLPIAELVPLEELVSRTLVRPRLFASLLAVFSGLALVLAVVGLYGVVSFAVAQRTREIAVRMALGAAQASVLRLVLGRAVRLSGLGLALGLLAALVTARVLAGQLYGVAPNDPATFLVVGSTLALAALVAGYLPARRAVRVAPASALRAE